MELHGKNIMSALVYGVAGVAPRSTMQNLSEVLHCMASRRTTQTRAFLNEILFSVRKAQYICNLLTYSSFQPDFTSKYPMATQKVKEQFMSSLMA